MMNRLLIVAAVVLSSLALLSTDAEAFGGIRVSSGGLFGNRVRVNVPGVRVNVPSVRVNVGRNFGGNFGSSVIVQEQIPLFFQQPQIGISVQSGGCNPFFCY